MDVTTDRELSPELAADVAAAALTVARRSAAGATLWCLAPSWPPHAQHLAVEFVHPVIVGKRALPAVSLTGPNLVATVRVSVRAGDLLVAVGTADDVEVRSLMLRSRAWGATTIWLGNGARPPAGAADHVLWLENPDPRVPVTGDVVMLYHVLWELTHVCFEHPGLLTPTPADEREDVCVTCSDEGRLAEVVAVRGDCARVRTPTGIETIATATLSDAVRVGDMVLVHAGTAIGTVDPLGWPQ